MVDSESGEDGVRRGEVGGGRMRGGEQKESIDGRRIKEDEKWTREGDVGSRYGYGDEDRGQRLFLFLCSRVTRGVASSVRGGQTSRQEDKETRRRQKCVSKQSARAEPLV